MIYIDEGCSKCRHRFKNLLDGWKTACDAYPNGIPTEIIIDSDVRTLDECAPGYKWEPREENEN